MMTSATGAKITGTSIINRVLAYWSRYVLQSAALPALPSTSDTADQTSVFAIVKTHSVEVPANIGPAMPGEFV